MKEKLSKLSQSNIIFSILLYPAKVLYHLLFHYLVPDKVAIERKFKKIWGYDLDIKNPKTFSEKLQWLKLNDRKSWYTNCADKMLVREYVSEKLGTDKYLIPLYFSTENYKEITKENIPSVPCVIKCSHDNNSYKIIQDKENENWNELRQYYKGRLNSVNIFWSNREWPYKSIKKRWFMVEAFLQSKGEDYKLQEYKFHCFNGELKIIDVYQIGTEGFKRARILNDRFEPYSEEHSMGYPNVIKELILPDEEVREEMLDMVKTLAKDFEYQIRIDVYHVDGKLYIGELTFFDGAGFDFITPKEFNRELGDMLKLPIDNN
ncbi:hypothetical protein DF185_02530 [Marinifilum breve]|uniref:Glycosyl transferase n=1 Tax=Marinifilum breve TaxID=2184082 RepID=A0A2V4A3A3_9BACT|nr:ATP-grasp fold amidoligase family protein [Marinifilum breve]PXY02988.1 hypothetical protein DF185_02530 [Marinifilum breve]